VEELVSANNKKK